MVEKEEELQRFLSGFMSRDNICTMQIRRPTGSHARGMQISTSARLLPPPPQIPLLVLTVVGTQRWVEYN